MAQTYESALPLGLTFASTKESSSSIIVRLVWTLEVPARNPSASGNLIFRFSASTFPTPIILVRSVFRAGQVRGL